MTDKTELDALARMNAARDANTCPASRHAATIADALVNGEPYPMLSEEPKYCGATIAAVVASLWETRTALSAAKAEDKLKLQVLADAVGENAVTILLRNDPNASILRRQSVRQAYSAPIRNMLPKDGA